MADNIDYNNDKPGVVDWCIPNGRKADSQTVTNKPMCARVAAMTTVAHNKSQQHYLNTKVNFILVLPYA